jgi:hypothetical protein
VLGLAIQLAPLLYAFFFYKTQTATHERDLESAFSGFILLIFLIFLAPILYFFSIVPLRSYKLLKFEVENSGAGQQQLNSIQLTVPECYA